MSDAARIQSIDVLREVKAALLEFAKEAGLCITSVDAEVQRTGQWVTMDRPNYWKHEVRRREEAVEAAKAEIRRKELAAMPNPADVVLERKALSRAKARLERAMEKRDRVRKWAPVWERESMLFKGGCAPLNEVLHRDIPQAIARLDKMMDSLEEYFRLQAPETSPPPETSAAPGDQGVGAAGAMARPLDAVLAHPGDKYGPLRAHIPPPAERLAVPEFEMPLVQWQAGVPTTADTEAIARLALGSSTPGPGQLITVAYRAFKADAVFLVRNPSADEGGVKDSGWYIGPLEHPHTTGGTRVCTLAELLARVPGLAPLLTLSPGSLVVLHRGIIKALLNGDNHDLWGAGGSGVVLTQEA